MTDQTDYEERVRLAALEYMRGTPSSLSDVAQRWEVRTIDLRRAVGKIRGNPTTDDEGVVRLPQLSSDLVGLTASLEELDLALTGVHENLQSVVTDLLGVLLADDVEEEERL